MKPDSIFSTRLNPCKFKIKTNEGNDNERMLIIFSVKQTKANNCCFSEWFVGIKPFSETKLAPIKFNGIELNYKKIHRQTNKNIAWHRTIWLKHLSKNKSDVVD